jgi:hypothetical protein
MFLPTTTVVRTGEMHGGAKDRREQVLSLSSLRLVWLVISILDSLTTHTHPHALVFAFNGFDMIASTHFSRDREQALSPHFSHDLVYSLIYLIISFPLVLGGETSTVSHHSLTQTCIHAYTQTHTHTYIHIYLHRIDRQDASCSRLCGQPLCGGSPDTSGSKVCL